MFQLRIIQSVHLDNNGIQLSSIQPPGPNDDTELEAANELRPAAIRNYNRWKQVIGSSHYKSSQAQWAAGSPARDQLSQYPGATDSQ